MNALFAQALFASLLLALPAAAPPAAMAPSAPAVAADASAAAAPPAPAAAAAASDPAAPTLSREERHAAARVSAAAISGAVRFLADDLLEGREPGKRGDELATRFLASELEALGLQPGAPAPPGQPRSFYQEVPFVELTAQVPEFVSFAAKDGTGPLALRTREGEQAELVLSADAHLDKAVIDHAELVFAGYGIVAPEYGWDDYKDVDVRGKIVVLLNFNPQFAGEVAGHRVRLWYGRWDYKYLTAAAHGAIGALIIHTNESAGYPWRVLSNGAGAESQRLDLPPEPGEPRMQVRGWLRGDAAEKLVARAGLSLAKLTESAQARSFRATPLGLFTSLSMPIARHTFESDNVIGMIPGRDESMRGEAVVYSAHHDHLGQKPPVPPSTDGIYNGALDNASGCAALLAIARAAIQSPPRRSLLFLFTTGEEEGLLGARYFAAHPTFPAGRLAADINIDVINIFGRTRDLTVLGLGKSSLDETIRAVARAQGRSVHGDAAPDKGEFYRSDHFALARVGVPVAAVVGGPDYRDRPAGWGESQLNAWIERNYHQVTDEYHGDWDLSGAVQDAQLQLLVGLRVANASELPHWTAGDEFEAIRKAAPR